MADVLDISEDFLNELSKATFQSLKEILDLPLAPSEPGLEERIKQRLVVVKIFGEFLNAASKKRKMPKGMEKALERAEVIAVTAERVEARRQKIAAKKKQLEGQNGPTTAIIPD